MGVALEASHLSEEGVTLPPTQSVVQHCARLLLSPAQRCRKPFLGPGFPCRKVHCPRSSCGSMPPEEHKREWEVHWWEMTSPPRPWGLPAARARRPLPPARRRERLSCWVEIASSGPLASYGLHTTSVLTGRPNKGVSKIALISSLPAGQCAPENKRPILAKRLGRCVV